MLEQAAKIYEGRKYFQPEAARVSYKLSKVLERLQRSDEAADMGDHALSLYKESHPDENYLLEDLTDADFDRDIMFWSR